MEDIKFTDKENKEIILTEEHLKIDYAYQVGKGILKPIDLEMKHFSAGFITRALKQMKYGYRVAFQYDLEKRLLIYNK